MAKTCEGHCVCAPLNKLCLFGSCNDVTGPGKLVFLWILLLLLNPVEEHVLYLSGEYYSIFDSQYLSTVHLTYRVSVAAKEDKIVY